MIEFEYNARKEGERLLNSTHSFVSWNPRFMLSDFLLRYFSMRTGGGQLPLVPYRSLVGFQLFVDEIHRILKGIQS